MHSSALRDPDQGTAARSVAGDLHRFAPGHSLHSIATEHIGGGRILAGRKLWRLAWRRGATQKSVPIFVPIAGYRISHFQKLQGFAPVR